MMDATAVREIAELTQLGVERQTIRVLPRERAAGEVLFMRTAQGDYVPMALPPLPRSSGVLSVRSFLDLFDQHRTPNGAVYVGAESVIGVLDDSRESSRLDRVTLPLTLTVPFEWMWARPAEAVCHAELMLILRTRLEGAVTDEVVMAFSALNVENAHRLSAQLGATAEDVSVAAQHKLTQGSGAAFPTELTIRCSVFEELPEPVDFRVVLVIRLPKEAQEALRFTAYPVPAQLHAAREEAGKNLCGLLAEEFKARPAGGDAPPIFAGTP
jgi:hypothetical protein